MATLDYEKLPVNRVGSNVTPWIGPTANGALGITDIAVPTAVELNNTGGASGIQMAAKSISWNDFDFGTQASEVQNEPSMGDSSTFEEFGQSNYGGSMSFYFPLELDDPTNPIAVIDNLVDTPGEVLDTALRIDGVTPTTTAAADGDFVSTYRAELDGDSNPFSPGESKRHTVSFLPKSAFAHYTLVGAHVITLIPPAVTPWAAGNKARLRASVQGRDYTNALRFTSSDGDVVAIDPGGFYEVTGAAAGTATITAYDDAAGTSETVTVTVTA